MKVTVLGAVIATCLSQSADAWTCSMTQDTCLSNCETLNVAFQIDPAQFAPPLDRNDPPQRQVTRVTYGPANFVAEALRMEGGIEGFFEDAGDLGSRLMIVQPDGTARLSVQPSNVIWTGICTRS